MGRQVALASKKRTVVKRVFGFCFRFGCARLRTQNKSTAREGMAPVGAVKVLLATGPRALLRSTLTARTSALMRC